MFRHLFGRQRMPQSLRRSVGSPSAAARSRRHLLLEGLEDRTVPSILFHQGVAVTLTDHNPGQARGTVLTSPQVELVFWGSSWNTGSNPSLRTNVINAVGYIISGAYVGALGQYGVSTGVVAGSVTITSSSPAKNFTDSQVRSLLSGNIGGSIPYNNRFLYL